ncbi:MAG: 3-hydroxyacyl-CoA dehydrogenase family protein [Sulfolobaceae archaeon]
MRNIRTVTVVGAGVIGSGWATLLSTKGYNVIFYTEKFETLNKGINRIKDYLNILYENNLIQNNSEYYLKNIFATTNLNEAAKDTDFVIEAIIEDYDAKKEIFRKLDSMLDKDIIIASSTSGLLISVIQKAMKRYPERAIIAHPWNPPHLIPLVEIVPGEMTSAETISITREFMEKLEREVVVLKREIPGFIGNRLAFALFREALYLVDEGIVTVEDIDKVVTSALGLRWAFMGPFLTYHLGGGEGGLEYFFTRGFGYGVNEWLYTLSDYKKFPYTAVTKAINQMREYSKIKGKSFQELSKWRDEMLIKLIKVLRGKD